MPPTKSHDHSLADLVVCLDLSLQSAFGIAGKVGIVAESRKRDARVLYASPDRSLWLPHASLRAATAEETASSDLAAVADLARRMRASSVEIESPSGGGLRIVMRHGAITPQRIDELREHLGTALQAWKIRPGSMSRLESVFEIRT